MISQAEQRAALVDALDGVTADVDGTTVTIDAHPVRPTPTAAYQAWPIFMAGRPTAMCVAETDWQVAIALPGADAQTWTLNGDALIQAVWDALAEWHVTRWEPGQIPVADGAPLPALIYTLDI